MVPKRRFDIYLSAKFYDLNAIGNQAKDWYQSNQGPPYSIHVTEQCISIYITYISVSKSTLLAVTGPHGQLASGQLLRNIFLKASLRYHRSFLKGSHTFYLTLLTLIVLIFSFYSCYIFIQCHPVTISMCSASASISLHQFLSTLSLIIHSLPPIFIGFHASL